MRIGEPRGGSSRRSGGDLYVHASVVRALVLAATGLFTGMTTALLQKRVRRPH